MYSLISLFFDVGFIHYHCMYYFLKFIFIDIISYIMQANFPDDFHVINWDAVTWDYPIQIVNVNSVKDTRVCVGDDCSVQWRDPNRPEYARVESFIRISCGRHSFVLFYPLWYQIGHEHTHTQFLTLKRYDIRSEAVSVNLISEQVLVAHHCECSADSKLSPCRAITSCKMHGVEDCNSGCDPTQFGTRFVHSPTRKHYLVVTKEDGFSRDSQSYNLDWMSKITLA